MEDRNRSFGSGQKSDDGFKEVKHRRGNRTPRSQMDDREREEDDVRKANYREQEEEYNAKDARNRDRAVEERAKQNRYDGKRKHARIIDDLNDQAQRRRPLTRSELQQLWSKDAAELSMLIFGTDSLLMSKDIGDIFSLNDNVHADFQLRTLLSKDLHLNDTDFRLLSTCDKYVVTNDRMISFKTKEFLRSEDTLGTKTRRHPWIFIRPSREWITRLHHVIVTTNGVLNVYRLRFEAIIAIKLYIYALNGLRFDLFPTLLKLKMDLETILAVDLYNSLIYGDESTSMVNFKYELYNLCDTEWNENVCHLHQCKSDSVMVSSGLRFGEPFLKKLRACMFADYLIHMMKILPASFGIEDTYILRLVEEWFIPEMFYDCTFSEMAWIYKVPLASQEVNQLRFAKMITTLNADKSINAPKIQLTAGDLSLDTTIELLKHDRLNQRGTLVAAISMSANPRRRRSPAVRMTGRVTMNIKKLLTHVYAIHAGNELPFKNAWHRYVACIYDCSGNCGECTKNTTNRIRKLVKYRATRTLEILADKISGSWGDRIEEGEEEHELMDKYSIITDRKIKEQALIGKASVD